MVPLKPATLEQSAMNKLLAYCLLASAALPAQQIPAPTEVFGQAFFIKQTRIVGGAGNWDYLTVDPVARRLFIAHGTVVQVVDLDTGTLAGRIAGLREAHAIALDDTGEFGYISDGLAGQVKVFDRRSLQVVASIPTGPVPRSLVFEPQSRLLFAICTSPGTDSLNQAPTTAQPAGNRGETPLRATGRSSPENRNTQPVPGSEIKTSVTVIDVQTREPLAEILMPGKLGFAEADGNGRVFINIVNRNQIARLDAQAIVTLLGRSTAGAASIRPAVAQSGPASSSPAKQLVTPTVLDWSHESRLPESAEGRMSIFNLGSGCLEPQGLAIDSSHQRLFAACNNMKMVVLNAATGELVASLPTGPGTDAIGYDQGRGLIYTANGGADGSLTVIHQDVTDTYAVIQILPTRRRARTLAVNPVTGEVYLVTDLLGVNLAQPGTIGTLQTAPVKGSFQVLVIGN
jgi:DNA-binding beta-propeller fold protein YncE